MSLETAEREKYEKVWTFKEYRQHSPGELCVEKAVHALGMTPGESVIDYGCGPGRATAKFNAMGFNVLGVDHAHNCLDDDVRVPLTVACLWDLPILASDWAFCCDVMEHIPEEKVELVLEAIRVRTRKGAFFQIATFNDGFGLQLVGKPLHLTVKPADWWREKLWDVWANVEMRDHHMSPVYVCG